MATVIYSCETTLDDDVGGLYGFLHRMPTAIKAAD